MADNPDLDLGAPGKERREWQRARNWYERAGRPYGDSDAGLARWWAEEKLRRAARAKHGNAAGPDPRRGRAGEPGPEQEPL